MARRQVYGFNPGTGRVEHHYVDLGRMTANTARGTVLVPTFVPGGDGHQNVTANGGGQQPRIERAA